MSYNVNRKGIEITSVTIAEFVKQHHANVNQNSCYINAYQKILKEIGWKYIPPFDNSAVDNNIDCIARENFFSFIYAT
ncbi:hypothetical protein ABK905_03450 [Acerihabitans sp. KWT182]|uniref:Uncharacterized protein n=1 Tax=Acerihabitans sp. KWT182 TaxID=3157919 RepID=A0AAU7QAZ9_9GAMM